MPTLLVETIRTPENTWLVRCPMYPAFRPAPVERVDRAAMEKQIRRHQTKVTTFQWMGADQ